MLFNLEYDRLIKDSKVNEAINLSISSFVYVDDSFNYKGMLKGREHMIHNKFILEYEESEKEAKFVGVIEYKCGNCRKLSVKMDRTKHRGSFFPKSLLDHYQYSNAPHGSLVGQTVNSAIRIYRQNSDPNVALQAFAELKEMMMWKKYPCSANNQIKNKIAIMTILEPKSDYQEYMEIYLNKVTAVLNIRSKRKLQDIYEDTGRESLCFNCCNIKNNFVV